MELLEGYKITETVKENSYILCHGFREKDNLPVIIKYTSSNNNEQAMLMDHEYEIAYILDHSFTIKPIALEHNSEIEAMVYEDFQGISLEQYLHNNKLEIRDFLEIAISIAGAISKLHAKGIVHKDINPRNILINPENEEVKIINFGIASLLPVEYSSPIFNPKLLEGTLPYISPEQTGRMNRILDYRTDMYSLGITFYYMLTNTLPFKADDALGWVYNHIVRVPKSPGQINPEIPMVISDITMKLMSKLAEERYQSMEGLIYDLKICLSDLRQSGIFHFFTLGENDYSGRFQISQKKYGRKKEVGMLLESFEQVINFGMSQLILVSGYPGIGKTALVNEIHKPIVQEKGFYLTGKFDQHQRDIPYACMVDAFKELVNSIFSQPESELQSWKEKILAAVGINGQIIIDIIPQIELIIGPQPDVVELPATEAMNRFNMVFEKFISVFANREHPLTMFLDDLHWADTASLGLIKQIVTNPANKYILLIGAYRDNEVYPSHPMVMTMDSIKKIQVPVKDIVLQPLKLRDIESLVGDTLKSSGKKVSQLAELVYEKTGGNPFFSIQFLMALYKEGLLNFDYETRQWNWKLKEIAGREYTHNVADLMEERIRKMEPEIQELLKLASCIGNTFSLGSLSVIASQSKEEVKNRLKGAVAEGLVYSYDHTYKFLHDRLQEAAYSLIPVPSRPELHLRIGRLLSKDRSQEELEGQVFDIVSQFNYGLELITDPEEKDFLYKLNYMAGKKAKASTAYAVARGYLSHAARLLKEEDWEARYEDKFTLLLELAECEFLSGNYDTANEYFNLLLIRAANKLDKSKVYSLQIRLYQVLGNLDKALATGLEALKIFGIEIPTDEKEAMAVLKMGQDQLSSSLRKYHISDLALAPEASDPEVHAAIDLLIDTSPCAYSTNPLVYPLIVIETISLSLKYGNTKGSGFAYAAYALIKINNFEDLPGAIKLGEMSLKLNDRFHNKKLRGTILAIYGAAINPWGHSWASSDTLLEEGFEASLNVGDYVFAGYNATLGAWIRIEMGGSFSQVRALIDRYMSFAVQSRQRMVVQVLRAHEQFLKVLEGDTASPLSLDGNGFKEEEFAIQLHKTNYVPGIINYHLLKQVASFIFNDYEEALNHGNKAQELEFGLTNLPFYSTNYAMLALSMTMLSTKAPNSVQKEYRQALNRIIEKLKYWSDNCPENFHNRYMLVLAEMARIENRNMDAMLLYEEAIKSAHENQLTLYIGLSYELAGKFYMAIGFSMIAKTYLESAHNYWGKYGADGKVRQMEGQYAFLRNKSLASSQFLGLPLEQLDLLSIIKASQSISGQINLDELIEKLMNIVVEQAGAEKAWLFLVHNDMLWVAAHAWNVSDKIIVQKHDNVKDPDPKTVPMSLVQFVKQKKEKVLLDDASRINMFSSDEYLLSDHFKSIACLPIIIQNKITGVLYLENNLITGAFSRRIISTLEIIAAQAAISLENAILFKDLKVSRQQLQDIMDNSSAVIYVKGTDGRYLFVNKTFSDFFEKGKDMLLGKTDEELWAKDFSDVVISNDNKVLESHEPQTFEEVIRLKDGSYRAYIALKFPLRDPDGNVYAICGISTDITERKKAEREIYQLNEELQNKTQELRVAIEELSDSNTELIKTNQDLDDFIYTASHDLKIPIANLEGLINLLKDSDFDPEERFLISDMMDVSTNQLVKTINELEEISKVQRGVTEEEEEEEVELAQVTSRVLFVLQDQIDASHARVEFDFLDAPSIYFSQKNLYSIVYNLVSNAIKFKFPDRDPEIFLKSSNVNNNMLLSIKDNGLGFSEEQKDKIFKMFKKVHANTEGAGVGLYIVKRIVENAGGKVFVHSREGEGTEFKICLKRKTKKHL